MQILQQVSSSDSPQAQMSRLTYGFTYKISQELEEQMLLIKIFLKLLEDSQQHLSHAQQLEYLQMIQDSVQQMTQALHEMIEDFVTETAQVGAAE
ncbi:MAG: hypothetical protein RID09_24430 [Coleofasciculus sp. G1-WW12-02]|uniref:hypothetical protein n=1 Tax=unclassified Coleofasciculus TaxID=2692782 RepID=UPI0032F68DEF